MDTGRYHRIVEESDGEDSPLPGELPLTDVARLIAIDLRTRGIHEDLLRLHGRLDRVDSHLADLHGKTMKAVATLTDKVMQLAPHREKLDTLSEQVIEAAVRDAAAKARDDAHDAKIAGHEAHIRRLWKAVGAGAVVSGVAITIGTIAAKLIAAYLHIPLP